MVKKENSELNMILTYYWGLQRKEKEADFQNREHKEECDKYFTCNKKERHSTLKDVFNDIQRKTLKNKELTLFCFLFKYIFIELAFNWKPILM